MDLDELEAGTCADCAVPADAAELRRNGGVCDECMDAAIAEET